MWAKIDKLWPQTCVGVAFLYNILCIITHITQKLKVVKDVLPIKRLLYYWRYLFSGLELYVSYYWWVMSPSLHRNHFPIWHFVHSCTRNSKTTGHMQTFYILNDCSTIKDVYLLHVLELDVRYEWRVTTLNMHHSLFPISHSCIYSVLRYLTWKLLSYVDVQHIKRLQYYQRHFLCGLEFH